jgi:hypothetical protein
MGAPFSLRMKVRALKAAAYCLLVDEELLRLTAVVYHFTTCA